MHVVLGNRTIPHGPGLEAAGRGASEGLYFEHVVDLKAGPHSALVQTQLPAHLAEAVIRVSVVDLACGRELAAASATLRPSGGDRAAVSFVVPAAGSCQITGWIDRGCQETLLRQLTVTPGRISDPDDRRFWFRPSVPEPRPAAPTVVILGTTSRCPASCASCPTNKLVTRAVPKGVMSMALFRDIIDDLAGLGFSGSIVFGLYGEPLLDPHLAERLRYGKSALPGAGLLIATTGAVYDAERHGEAIALCDGLAVHMEALTPEAYDTAMAPLKATRSFPRIQALFAAAGRKARIAMPLGRSNLTEITKTIDHSRRLGIDEPDFSALSNRCGLNPTYEADALAPIAACCSPDKIQSELVVDWDGTVVACCFDFMRHGQMGNLSKVRLRELVAGEAYRDLIDKLNRKQWHELPACRNCRCDDTQQVQRIARSAGVPSSRVIRIGPQNFLHGNGAAKGEAGGEVRGHAGLYPTSDFWPRRMLPGAARAHAVDRFWGPYWRLARGSYTARFHLAPRVWGHRAHLHLVLVLDNEIVAHHRFTEAAADRLGAPIAFTVPNDALFEFRVSSAGVDFDLAGVTLVHSDLSA